MSYNFGVMCKGKEEEERTKLKFSCSIFLTVKEINGTLGVYFALEHLWVVVYKSFHHSAVDTLEPLLYLVYRTPF